MYGKFHYAHVDDDKVIGPFKRKEEIPAEYQDRIFTQWEDDEHYFVFKPDGTADGPYARIKDIPSDVKGNVVGFPKEVTLGQNFRYHLEFDEDESDDGMMSIDVDQSDLDISTADISMYSVFGLDGKFYGPYRNLSEVPDHAVGFVIAMINRAVAHGATQIYSSEEAIAI